MRSWLKSLIYQCLGYFIIAVIALIVFDVIANILIYSWGLVTHPEQVLKCGESVTPIVVPMPVSYR